MAETVSGYLDARASQQRAHLERKQRIAARAVAPAFDTDPRAAPPPVPAPPPATPVEIDLASDDRCMWFFNVVNYKSMPLGGPLRVEHIQRMSAAHYGVTKLDLISSRRTADIVRPRQVAMYLAKTLTLRSLPEIGRKFGNRDHTTVLHAVRKIARLIDTDTQLAGHVSAIRASLGGVT